ncbi:ankyrin repeat domain-containing protein [Methylotetracoccus oryzae]|uniref:ankyrin repeat domain-containing protein n=1 Tax=Methylotetracoccus oryzae TaxID=1919059 RepID=UPI00111997CC|nr:ankyrin repeat domain-containing protein [Methylotetracoccus oryzae]
MSDTEIAPLDPDDPALTAWLLAQGFDGTNLAGSIEHGMTPLMQACRLGHRDIVDSLIAAGATLDAVNQDGNNALWLACYHGDPVIIDRLLAHGIAIDHQNATGATCLMYAASSGKSAVVAQLLAAGAQWALPNQDDLTALDMAASLECLQLLRAASQRRPLP